MIQEDAKVYLTDFRSLKESNGMRQKDDHAVGYLVFII
jgi:hypothetical protein